MCVFCTPKVKFLRFGSWKISFHKFGLVGKVKYEILVVFIVPVWRNLSAEDPLMRLLVNLKGGLSLSRSRIIPLMHTHQEYLMNTES